MYVKLRSFCIASAVFAFAALPASAQQRAALDANGNFSSLVSRYSAAYNVPESLIRRVIKRESGGNARIVSRGNYGLMQIKLGTARSMGYQGGAAGLLDADTNMNYAVKYLAGAWRLSGGSEARAVHYYASGYHYAAKHSGVRTARQSGETYAMLDKVKAFGSAAFPSAGALTSPANPDFH
jgi:soluble lytic murein transglycosylase-like protein